jgi:ACS family sodium-dependent inorganic phosphate cotransporter
MAPTQLKTLPLTEYWPRRFTLVAMSFVAILICYIDRVNMSVAIIPMSEELGWDQTTQGIVLSSFFYGYLATQILGGWLSDRLGGKAVLGVGVLFWSIFTILTPPGAMGGLVLLFLVRVAMGVGEGVSFPAVYSLIARWVPQQERSRSTALCVAGIPLGTILALLLTPMIVTSWGWEWAFYLFGAAGIFWYVAWFFLATDGPESHPTIAAHELETIAAGMDAGDASEEKDKKSLKVLLSKAPVWAIIISHFCNNWGLYVILTWLPTYINQALGVRVSDVGYYAFIPYVTMFLCLNLSGWIADKMIRQGVSVTFTRKLMQSIGFGGAASFLLLISVASNVTEAIFIMSCATAATAFMGGGFAVNHLDIAPRHAGVLMGLTNTAGTLPGIIGVTVTGLILEMTGSWSLVFGVSAGFYLFGLVIWLMFSTGERIFD